MPNHMHGIIVSPLGAGPRACPGIHAPESFIGQETQKGQIHEVETRQPQKRGQARGSAPARLSLPDVVHRFKSFTTAEYRNGVKLYDWPPFNGKLWLRNYYEHIIRNEQSLQKICQYIFNNPLKWAEDEDNPANIAGCAGTACHVCTNFQ
jgi:putative transposase